MGGRMMMICRRSLSSWVMMAQRHHFGVTGSTGSSGFHSTAIQALPGEIWRVKQGLPKNSNAYGDMTDLPDYTFVDGRPTPPGTGKVRRAVRNREFTRRIIELCGEVDYAVEREQMLRRQKEEDKQSVLNRKLKSKGHHVFDPSNRPQPPTSKSKSKAS